VSSARSVVQVTLWNSAYLGNTMLGQLALARSVRERFGLSTHFVLAPGAEGMPWLKQLDDEGTTWSIMPPRRRDWRAHLSSVIEQRDAVLVHTHFTSADLAGAQAARAAGVPCVWHVRTGFTGYPLRQRLTDLVKLRWVAPRSVSSIVAVSPWLAKFIRRRGAPARLIETVPEAIAMERFAEMPDAAAARGRLGLAEDEQVVLCLGWWPEVKGVDVFLDALQRVVEQHPRAVGLVVGEEQLRAFLAERAGETPPWLRVAGFVEDSAWLFAATDIFVSASRHEGQSFAIGEALACALPVVMSDIPGTVGWGDAPDVSTFASEDSQALAGRLDELLAQPPEARVAAAAGNRDWVQEHFAVDVWCERLCKIYEPLLAPNAPARTAADPPLP
jgi:glycosyltransferase involved in cell wall biosynthesis